MEVNDSGFLRLFYSTSLIGLKFGPLSHKLLRIATQRLILPVRGQMGF